MRALTTMSEYVAAVDIGGTKVVTALVSGDGTVGQLFTEPTNQSGPEAGIQQIIRLCKQAMQEKTVVGIGIGIPAVLEKNTDLVIWAPNLNGWRQVALKPALEKALGIPVVIEYDGHTAVLGEWWMGAGKGTENFVDIIIGTGIGGGIIANGKLLRGHNRLAGAAGWFVLSDCADTLAHNVGCWESLAAGPGIARRVQAGLADFPASTLHQITPSSITSKDVFEAAQKGDVYARKMVDETADLIGLGVANIVSLLNPERVVLGGGVGSHGEMLLPRVREVVKRWAQPASAEAVEIISSQLGAQAGLFGAAYAALNRDVEVEEEKLLRKIGRKNHLVKKVYKRRIL
ncbi:MAG: ROK family protein [Anaerolineae bacterium]|nr:ROK family protein [Anaerolineae bacterium]